MGQAAARSDFSRALSAMVVVALIVATTALMLVTLNTARALGSRDYARSHDFLGFAAAPHHVLQARLD